MNIHDCPRWPYACQCEPCECGQPMHAVEHAPGLFAWTDRPAGHPFAPAGDVIERERPVRRYVLRDDGAQT